METLNVYNFLKENLKAKLISQLNVIISSFPLKYKSYFSGQYFLEGVSKISFQIFFHETFQVFFLEGDNRTRAIVDLFKESENL